MKAKATELIDHALNWAVAKAEGAHGFMFDGITCGFSLNGQLRVLSHGWAPSMSYNPSTNWALAGPIIDREHIELKYLGYDSPPYWGATKFVPSKYERHIGIGPTALVAAMRCYVATKLGDEVEIPEELL